MVKRCRVDDAGGCNVGDVRRNRGVGPKQAADVVLGGLGSGKRARGTGQGFHQGVRHRDEVRVRPVDELRRSLSQRAQLQEQALRSHHRRQPMDRRRRGERPLRQAQRILRQERHQDERLHRADGHWLFAVAEEHAELLGLAGNGGCRWMDLSQGLVRQAGNPGGIQAEVQSRSRAAQDLRRTQGDW